MKFLAVLLFAVFSIFAVVTVSAEDVDCSAPAEAGRCFAYIESYYYDPEAKECKKFIYGGCQGNSNRFSTKEKCEEQCKK